MKKRLILLAAILIGLTPIVAQAVNVTVPTAPGTGYMLTSTTTGAWIPIAASGVTGNCVKWTANNGLSDFGAPCSSSSGSGNIATSSSETANDVPFWTSTNGTPATLSGGLLQFQFSPTLNRLSVPFASTTQVSASTGFCISSSCITSWSFSSSTLLSDNNTFSGSNNFTQNVGIGTASPIATLQIASTSAGVVYPLLLSDANSNSEVQIRLQPSTAATRYNVISAVNNGSNAIDTLFDTANGALPTEKMRITSAGNVGIATATPATTLSVTGSGYFTGGGIGVGVLNTTSGTLRTVGNITDGGTLTVNGATSTFANGINLTTGCYAIGGTCLAAFTGTAASSTLLGDNNTFSGSNIFTKLLSLLGAASTTQLSVFNTAYFGGTATSSFDSTGSLTLRNQLNLSYSGPGILYNNTGGATDDKFWVTGAGATTYSMYALNDAGNSQTPFLTATRSGANISSLVLTTGTAPGTAALTIDSNQKTTFGGNASSTLFTCTTCWVGTSQLIGSGGQWTFPNASATVVGGSGSTNAISVWSGTNLESFIGGYTIVNTGAGLLTAPNASTTNFTAGSSNLFSVFSTGEVSGFDNQTSVSGQISPMRYLSFKLATSTTWTASSSVSSLYADAAQVVMPFAGTVRTLACATSAGTLELQSTVNSNNDYYPASTTAGTYTFSNTFTKGQIMTVIGGNPTSAPTYATCTIGATQTP